MLQLQKKSIRRANNAILVNQLKNQKSFKDNRSTTIAQMQLIDSMKSGTEANNTFQLMYKLKSGNSAIVQNKKCKKCGAKSHSTNQHDKVKGIGDSEEKTPGVRVVSRNGCYNDAQCTDRRSGADYCHNCDGSHVSWTLGQGDRIGTFCLSCAELGQDEPKAKAKMKQIASNRFGGGIKA